ncbi:thioredoxin-like protein [Mycena floridula]|nr:thioredoxin-like protein [Mycena floridula]
MSINADEDTEFNDALRKHGILPPKEEAPRTPSPPPSPTLEDMLDELTLSEMQEMSEDAPDDETERYIAARRQWQLEHDKMMEKKARFGRIYPIGREDYTREVTEASCVNEPDDENDSGTGVICFLYKDGITASDQAFVHLKTLAARYPRTKFVSIVGDKCIPNLPDARIPMLIIYKKGEILNQVVAWGRDRPRIIEELEAMLLVAGAVHIPDLPRKGRKSDDSDEEEDEAPSRMRSAATATNGRRTKNIRKSEDSDGSDFEFDL